MEEVCPTEDMFMTLLDTLLRPYLHQNPQQHLIANQMHAVVLLYNYYHRKRHPAVEYLDFTSCCQLAVIFNPMLLSYMNLMRQPHYKTVSDINAQLSLTEQAIMNACKVSSALFALEDVPFALAWPISKVTVLLVDSTRDNCFLLFDSITKGIWSPIQTDLPFSATQEHTHQDALLQLAFSGVKETAGIDYTDVEVLESHTVYSLNEEKKATHFFIVQSSQSITKDHQVHVKDVIESLQGPLVLRSNRGWKLTPVHQYFHLLPYTDILSDWFSREQLLKHLRVTVKDKVTQCPNPKEFHQENEVVDQNITHEYLCVSDAVNIDASDGSHDPTKQELNDGCSYRILMPENVGDEFYKHASGSVKGSHPIKETTAMEIERDVLPTDTVLMENGNECSDYITQQDKVDVDLFGSVNINHLITKTDSMDNDKCDAPNDINLMENGNECSNSIIQQDKVDVDMFGSVNIKNINTKTFSMETDKYVSPYDINLAENGNECSNSIIQQDTVNVDMFGSVNINHPVAKEYSVETDKCVSPNDINLVENGNECSNSIIQQDKVDVDMFGSVNINYPITKTDSMKTDKNVSRLSPNDINLVAPKTNSVTEITSKLFKEVESKSSRISSSRGDVETSGNLAVDSHQLNSINLEKPTSNLALDEDALQQASLKPLLEKREKLIVQRRSVEKELALCEKRIQTFIKGDANDIEVKMQAVEEFCDCISTNSTTKSQDRPGLGPCQHLEDPVTLHAKRKRSSVSILTVQNPCPESCKELDIFCCRNNWMLPTYRVRSSHDGFHADVKVKGVELALSERSDLKTTPAEARASAAVKMMDLLERVLPKQ